MSMYDAIFGARISIPISITFLLSKASEAAKLMEMKVLPSPEREDVINATLSLASLKIKSIFARIKRKSSVTLEVSVGDTIRCPP